jgi:hypothetical protein
MLFKKNHGNWTNFRSLERVEEVDFHYGDMPPIGLYHENMAKVRERAFKAIVDAQKKGANFVLFTHGHSTSRRGKTTARSMVRSLMRSKDATPYIIRRECIQHSSVFVAAIRPIVDCS